MTKQPEKTADLPSVTKSIHGQIDLIEEVIASFPDKGHLLDIGTGSGLAARRFHEEGWQVTATGFNMEDYLDATPLPEAVDVVANVDVCDAHQFESGTFDAIWCAHVLEHVSNTGLALAELRRLLKPDGWLFITVPPYKNQVVGGHVNSGWNIGTLMYVLADAGFGLAEGRFIRHGYNVFGMVQRGPGPMPSDVLRRANGDIEILRDAGRFPAGFIAEQGYSGLDRSVNWRWIRSPEQVLAPRAEHVIPPPIAPMKLGFFVPWISLGKGGTENVGHQMANALAVRGHEVTIFTFDDKKQPSRWPLDPSITLVHLSEAEDEPADRQMTIEIATRNLDVLVGLHMNRTMLRYVRCAHRVGLPLVLSEHIDPRFPRWVGKFSAEERDIAMSGATMIHLLHDGFTSSLNPAVRHKVRVIPNTITEPQVLADLTAPRETRIVLAVARLVPRKNMSRLLDAFAQLADAFPDWCLHIVGDGPLRQPIGQKANDLGLDGRVVFAGEHDNVYPFYAAADLFVIPSLFEGFPLTLCEAVAHGLPAVGFRLCEGVAEQIVDGETGLLCDGDSPEALAAALRQLMEDQGTRQKMGENARRLFLERFANDVVHDQWEALFAEAKERYTPHPAPAHANLMAVRLWDMVHGTGQ